VTPSAEAGAIRLGLGANLGQFSLLVLINAFVGAMVGLERTVVPLIGEREFGLASKTAIVSFIVSFGVTKALLNLMAARLAERFGRKPILVVGWLLGLPVPFMIMWAPSWGWCGALSLSGSSAIMPDHDSPEHVSAPSGHAACCRSPCS
jgi:MFS family permease